MPKDKEAVGLTKDEAIALYNAFTSEYRDIIAGFPHIAEMIASDLRPILLGVFKTINAIEDQELALELETMRTSRAKKRMYNLLAYRTAGFTREEAMQLILYDAEKTSAIVSKALANNTAGDKAKEVINRKRM
jgi:hypothetical protein